MKVAWFSCGATSAVACKIALELYKDVKIIYIETGSHHIDNTRFLQDCENWYDQKIDILQSRYTSVQDVIKKTKFVNSPSGASCTKMLKTRVRQEFEYNHPEVDTYIWGFEYTPKEINRAERICERYPEYKHLFPLQEKMLNKENCLCILQNAGIEIPKMYKLGYHNNNCIGCVKDGMGYWNKIRVDFPKQFDEMSKIEREIGHSCLKQYFLDELPVNKGNHKTELMPECSIFCNDLIN